MPTSIKAIKESLEAVTSLLDPLFQELATDTRSGVQKSSKKPTKGYSGRVSRRRTIRSHAFL